MGLTGIEVAVQAWRLVGEHEDEPRRRWREWTAVGLLVLLQVVLFRAMQATSSSEEGGDPFDSSLYWWSWLLLPALALITAWLVPAAPPLLWTAAIVVPMVVAVTLAGTVGHDPDEGASLWMVGVVFVLLQGLVVHAGARAGARLGRRGASPPRR